MVAYGKFNCIKIQPNNNYRVCGVYSLQPLAEVYCVRLNFNISKLVCFEQGVQANLLYNNNNNNNNNNNDNNDNDDDDDDYDN